MASHDLRKGSNGICFTAMQTCSPRTQRQHTVCCCATEHVFRRASGSSVKAKATCLACLKSLVGGKSLSLSIGSGSAEQMAEQLEVLYLRSCLGAGLDDRWEAGVCVVCLHHEPL